MRNRILAAMVFLSVVAVNLTPVRADTIHVPWQFANLQDAINFADPGDVILVDGGTHGPIVVDRPLTIVGGRYAQAVPAGAVPR